MNGPNLGVLRSALAPMLTATGEIERSTGRTEPVEGSIGEDTIYEVVYAGPVLVRPDGSATKVSVGGVTLPVSRYDVTLPADTDAMIGDRLTITSADHDPALVGQVLRLTDVPLDTWQVARFCKAKRDT